MAKWKKISVLVALVLVGLVTIAAYKPSFFTGGVRIGPHPKGIQPYLLQVENPTGTTIFSIDNQGRINQDKIVLLNNANQFSTWAGNNTSCAASGVSYYQMVAGRTYVVDVVAMLNSDLGKAGALGTLGGVTLHLPLATADNDYQTVEVMYAQRNSGTSATPVAFTVQVWPAPLAGTTTWAVGALGGASMGRQNMVGMATSGSSVMTTFSATGSYNINAIGEYGIWQLMNDSATSAVMKRSGVMTP